MVLSVKVFLRNGLLKLISRDISEVTRAKRTETKAGVIRQESMYSAYEYIKRSARKWQCKALEYRVMLACISDYSEIVVMSTVLYIHTSTEYGVRSTENQNICWSSYR